MRAINFKWDALAPTPKLRGRESEYHDQQRRGWSGLVCGYYCITACSEDCSLASNLRAQQQGVAIQQSDSSE